MEYTIYNNIEDTMYTEASVREYLIGFQVSQSHAPIGVYDNEEEDENGFPIGSIVEPISLNTDTIKEFTLTVLGRILTKLYNRNNPELFIATRSNPELFIATRIDFNWSRVSTLSTLYIGTFKDFVNDEYYLKNDTYAVLPAWQMIERIKTHFITNKNYTKWQSR